MALVEKLVVGASAKDSPNDGHNNSNGDVLRLKEVLKDGLILMKSFSDAIEETNDPVLIPIGAKLAEKIIRIKSSVPRIVVWERPAGAIEEDHVDRTVQDASVSGVLPQIPPTTIKSKAEGNEPWTSDTIDRARLKDEEAMVALYEGLFPRVYRYMLARTKDAHTAEDLAEDTMEKAILQLDKYQERPATPFTAWVFRIAHNCVISYRRKETTRFRIISGQEIPENFASSHKVEDEVVISSEFERAKMAILKLPEFQRMVMELRFIAGLSVKQTAEVMGKGEGNVKVIQHKALIRLRELLGAKPWPINRKDIFSSEAIEQT